MVNTYWLSSSFEGLTDFSARGCISDHTLSLVSFLEDRASSKKPFKFFNTWALSHEFLGVVEKKWNFFGMGTAQFRLKHMLNGMKKPLKLLNIKKFSHISSRAVAAKRELEEMQNVMLTASVISDRHKEKRRHTELLMEAERLFLAQKRKASFYCKVTDVLSISMILSSAITKRMPLCLFINPMGS